MLGVVVVVVILSVMKEGFIPEQKGFVLEQKCLTTSYLFTIVAPQQTNISLSVYTRHNKNHNTNDNHYHLHCEY